MRYPMLALVCAVRPRALKLSLPSGTPLLAAITFAAASVGVGVPAACQTSYTITEIGSLRAGGYGLATAINNSGQVVGYSETGRTERAYGSRFYIYHAFRWDPKVPNGTSGVLKDLGAVSGKWSAAYGINDAGQVVGWTGDNPGTTTVKYAFVHNGSMKTLPMPAGQAWSVAYCINNLGQVAGHAAAANGWTNAMRWDSGGPTNLGALSGLGHTAYAINDSGRSVGVSDYRAFRTAPNATIDPATDDIVGGSSAAYACNSNGEVVGYYSDAAYLEHAFVHRGGSLVDLGAPRTGDTQTSASGINDSGEIVGRSFWSHWEYSTRVDENTAVIWRNGQMIDLNTVIPSNSGWYLLWAKDINNKGQIICHARRADFSTGELLLTPRF